MRDIVGRLLHFAHQDFDAVEHRIEVFRQLIPFILRPEQRHALAKTALHDGPAGGVDRFDPADRAPGDSETGNDGENENQRDNERKGEIDLPPELIEIADVPSDQQMGPVGERGEIGANERRLRRVRLPFLHAEVASAGAASQYRRPAREISGQHRER